MPGLILVLGSAVLVGLSDFLYRQAQLRKIYPATFLFVQSVCFNLSNLLLGLASTSLQIRPVTLLIAMPAGLCLFCAVTLFLRSLRTGDATVNVPVYKLSFIVTALGAFIFLGEAVTVAKLIAIGLAVIGILSLADIDKLITGSTNARSLSLLLPATGLYGLYSLLQKLGAAHHIPAASFLVVQGLTFVVPAFLLAWQEDGFALTPATLSHAPLCALLLSSSLFLLLLSLKEGEASVNIPIVQLSFIITSLLAVVVLRESVTPRKVIGTIAAVLAVLVFAFGK